MTPFYDSPDFTLYVGDVLEQLAHLPDGSVDCVVTSPPYWGLRDYGTGAWVGGNPDCDHIARTGRGAQNLDKLGERLGTGGGHKASSDASMNSPYRDVCGKCGAQRKDHQLGLEATPDLYVSNMVAVFREVRRVLAGHGTCWVNLGDAFESKQLLGMPWRVSFALQADGWYLRADIIWAKPNPMPESVTDRPTKAHEYVFLLSKRPRYWFDQEAVREPVNGGTNGGRSVRRYEAEDFKTTEERNTRFQGPNPGDGGRNVRSVWEIATQPYPQAHFATYPEELVRRCILAGCPERTCGVCGKPSERIVETTLMAGASGNTRPSTSGSEDQGQRRARDGHVPGMSKVARTLGWSDCGCKPPQEACRFDGNARLLGVEGAAADSHHKWRPGVVLDPFLGSGTTALVARKHGRCCVGIELNPEYARLAMDRNAQTTLWQEAIT